MQQATTTKIHSPSKALLTASILTCHNSKITDVTYPIKDGSVLFKCSSHDRTFINYDRTLKSTTWLPTFPTMQLGCWQLSQTTSLEAIHQISHSFLWRHKRLYTTPVNRLLMCSSPLRWPQTRSQLSDLCICHYVIHKTVNSQITVGIHIMVV